uniref:Selenide, water dikinase n=1 Tax=Acrobeloides nanus TaxID=290746 RepID=A0A914DQX9_9BILA
MKGCGCKVPRDSLLELLGELQKGVKHGVDEDGHIDIGLDSCVIPSKHKGVSLVQTTDFFYPLVDDPFLMGRITCANVLSDLYAMGVHECDNMLMLLGVCTELDDSSRNIVISEFLKGFKQAADLADTRVRGGQTVRCPWLLLGGVASSVVADSEILRVDQAKPGDVLVLTKPLGGQVAVNSYEWIKANPEKITSMNLDEEKIRIAFRQVSEQMCRLNRNAAKLLHKYGARASTDVTGFGILGHAENLAKAQANDVNFVIETLPIIEYMDKISQQYPDKNGFRLFSGYAAETSGGLLIAMPAENAEKYIQEIQELDGFPAWVIGKVTEGNKTATIVPEYKVVSVPSIIE